MHSQHSSMQNASVQNVGAAPEPFSAFEKLTQVDKSLRDALARLSERLMVVLPPPQPNHCVPQMPTLCSPEPIRCPLKQLIYEMDVAVSQLHRTIDVIEL